MNIVIIDNYDSFTRNLEHLLAREAGVAPVIVPYTDVDAVSPAEWDIVVISPGPGKPEEYPGYGRIIDSGTPVLGICLGLQILNNHFGGTTSRLASPIHGRADGIKWKGQTREVARYHSLYLSRVAPELSVRAVNAQDIPMVVVHPSRPLLGFQFHPESFLTPNGGEFIRYAFEFYGLS